MIIYKTSYTMKQSLVIKLLSLLCLIFLIGNTQAQNKPGYTDLIKECEDLITKRMELDNLVGVSAAIMVDDSVIWKKGFGYADKDNQVPMTVNTVVNIASATKTFTALAIMQLQENGLLDIDQPVNKYLPHFHPKTRGEDLNDLTIRSVINHSSGIQTDCFKNSDLGSGKYTDVLGYINETYLMFSPNLVESYSNAGYNILGHLIKEVSKQDYPDYIHENILTPLGMSNSGFIMDSLENRTLVYSGGESIHEYGFRDIASGGIYTDINDFVKYARGLIDAYNGMNSSLITAASVQDMFSLQQDHVLIESNNKGLGWFMFRNDSLFGVTKAGDGAFGHAEINLIPEKKAAVMILINSAEGEPLRRDFCFKVISKFGLSVPDIIPPPVIKEVSKETETISLPDNMLKKHAGDYSQGFSCLTVSLGDNRLEMERDNKHYVLKPLTDNEFVPFEIVRQDSLVVKENERYCFMDQGNFHMLFHETGGKETRLGYRLNQFDPSTLSKRLGEYEHFGYQLLVGDTKFKAAELYLAENRILMLKLIAYEGAFPFPLNVISDEYAVTSGLGGGFDFNIKFTGDDQYDILDFAGLTFRKAK